MMFDKDKNEKEEMKKTKNNSSDIYATTLLINEYLEMIEEKREEKAAYDSISSRSLN